MSLFEELQNLMVKHRFTPNKRLGQNFIISEKIIGKIVDAADLNEKDTVLEIGSGTGFLTRELLKRCKVVAVEIDEKLCDLLQQELPSENLQLVRGNFLEADLPSFNKVAALPPYTHSAAIMYRLLSIGFENAALVFQREFAAKLVALPGYKEYGGLAVLTQYGFDAKIIARVEPGHFFPKPGGESCIVKLSKKEPLVAVKDTDAFSSFIKTLFRFQNKNLRNALLCSRTFLKQLGNDKKALQKKAEQLDMAGVKVNLISVKEFAEIFNQVSK